MINQQTLLLYSFVLMHIIIKKKIMSLLYNVEQNQKYNKDNKSLLYRPTAKYREKNIHRPVFDFCIPNL